MIGDLLRGGSYGLPLIFIMEAYNDYYTFD